jgi:PAS domain S-box-containing protein
VQLNLAVRGSSDGPWDRDLVTGELYLSPAYKQLLGYADHELESSMDAVRSLIHPDDREEWRRAIERHFHDGTPYRQEFRAQVRSGSYRWFVSRGEAIRDAPRPSEVPPTAC